MKSKLSMRLGVFFAFIAFATGARAEVVPAPLISNGMVLQQKTDVNVWGTADAGETIVVEFRGRHAKAVAGADGKWFASIPSGEAGGPFQMSLRGKNAVQLEDVLVGEVWVCSGQSNMEWALGRSTGGPEAIEKSANPMLHLCTIPHNDQLSAQETVATQWVHSGPETTKNFSAIAYWMGSKLQKELGVPVGIINDSYGGTGIQAWMPIETLKAGPWPQDKTTNLDSAKADYDRRVAEKKPVMDAYAAAKALAIKEHRPSPPSPTGLPGGFRGPSVLWNGMVAPLLHHRIRGVAWYQGESNAYVGVAQTYKDLLPAMIADWRKGFGDPDLPFVIFQIAANRKPQVAPDEPSGIAELQAAQLKTAQTVPHTALVVTDDLGEPDVHYKNKEPAGERGMLAALRVAYGRNLEYSGPVFNEMKIDGDKAILHFTHTSGGLILRENTPSGFVIAGDDHQFVFADARVDGDTVVVSSPKVPKPLAVRYAWADLPKVSLFGKEGLPASPFRTDDWPLPTSTKPIKPTAK